MTSVLSVVGYTLDFSTRAGMRRVLEDVSLTIAPGEVLGLVGESGSGKTSLARAVMRDLPANAHEGRGRIQLGATSDGPSSAANFIGLGTVSGMRSCSAGHYRAFDTKSIGYEDNVVSWPSVEPADDYTAASLFAFALGAGGLG